MKKVNICLFCFVSTLLGASILFAGQNGSKQQTSSKISPAEKSATADQVREVRVLAEKILGPKAESITFRLFGYKVVVAREYKYEHVGKKKIAKGVEGISVTFEQSIDKYVHKDGATYIEWTIAIEGYKTVKPVIVDTEDARFVLQALKVCAGLESEPQGKEVTKGLRMLSDLEMWLTRGRRSSSSQSAQSPVAVGVNVGAGQSASGQTQQKP
jgi:hypothetical protein